MNQKYRFDLGTQFLALLNFTLLLITASDKLRYYTNIPRTWILVVIAVPLGFFGMWMFGLFLDKIVRYGEGYNELALRRNPSAQQTIDQLQRIEAELKRLNERLK
jgi:hypothetical protein